jgi:hypothetical protein
VLCLLVLTAVAFPLRAGSAPGSPQQGGLPALEQRVASLEALAATLQGVNNAQAQQISALQGKVSVLQAAAAQGAARTAALEDRLVHFSRAGNEVFLTGANLNIVNGLGATAGNPGGGPAEVNGLGNLIVGYNEQQDAFFQRDRPGSHNLVVGRNHGYSFYGGLVAGYNNDLQAPYASVTGGVLNTAASFAAAIGGGRGNRATGNYSVVGGGDGNTAGGEAAAVGGGRSRQAPGLYDWAAGGLFEDL